MSLLVHPAEAIRALTGHPPERMLHAGVGQAIGAVWTHPPVETTVPGLAQHVLAVHLGGSTLVEKSTCGVLVGHRKRIGSVSLVPADRDSGWVIAGHARIAHLYVDPERLRALDPAGGSTALRDFFAEDDPVLVALVRLAHAQADAGSDTVDAMARDQIDVLIARHLLAHYRDGSVRPASAARRVTLVGSTLRRVLNHVETHLEQELRLGDLAALVCLSEDHFLRAFKAAVGQTPHQYLIGCRLARARRLLLEDDLPLAEIGRRCGFGNPSHFAAIFRRHEGVPPGVWARTR